MDPWWLALFRQQQSERFSDIAGSHASITLSLSDRMVGRLIADRVPFSMPIRDLEVVADPGNVIAIRVRVARPSFLPPIRMRLAIEQQPELPGSPICVLRLVSHGVAGIVATALKFVDLLPAGVRFDGRRFIVDLATLLEQRNAAAALGYVTALTITTAAHRIIVDARLAVPV